MQTLLNMDCWCFRTRFCSPPEVTPVFFHQWKIGNDSWATEAILVLVCFSGFCFFSLPAFPLPPFRPQLCSSSLEQGPQCISRGSSLVCYSHRMRLGSSSPSEPLGSLYLPRLLFGPDGKAAQGGERGGGDIPHARCGKGRLLKKMGVGGESS